MSADEAVSPVRRFEPIPPRLYFRTKYPLRTVLVAESFTVRCEANQAALDKLSNSLTSCISSVERKTGRRFTMRRIKCQFGQAGITVWRLS